MWEVLSFGDKPYGEMSNQEVSPGVSHTSHPLPKSSTALSCQWPHFFFLTHSLSAFLSTLVPFTSCLVVLTMAILVRGSRGSTTTISCEQSFLVACRVSFLPSSSLQVMKSIEDGYRLPPPVDSPARLYELMKNCWAHDCARRPPFHQLKAQLEHLHANPHSLRTIANFDPR